VPDVVRARRSGPQVVLASWGLSRSGSPDVLGQEQLDLGAEALGLLELDPVPGVGQYVQLGARNVLGEADEDYRKYFNYFSNERDFFLPSGLGKIIGKPMLFSLSNSWAKFKQVDKLREMKEGQKEF